MARRKKPCDFCQDDILLSENIGQNQLAVEFYPDNGLFDCFISIEDENQEPRVIEYSWNFEYCPVCGRKLDVW